MKQLFFGMVIGIGLICSSCCIAQDFIKASPEMVVV